MVFISILRTSKGFYIDKLWRGSGKDATHKSNVEQYLEQQLLVTLAITLKDVSLMFIIIYIKSFTSRLHKPYHRFFIEFQRGVGDEATDKSDVE